MAGGRPPRQEASHREGRTDRRQRKGRLRVLVQAHGRRPRGLEGPQRPLRAAAQLVRRGRLREREEGRRRAAPGRRGRARAVPRLRQAERDPRLRHEPRLRHGRAGHRLRRARRLLQEPRPLLFARAALHSLARVRRGRLGDPVVARKEDRLALRGAGARGRRGRARGARVGGHRPRPGDEEAPQRTGRRQAGQDLAQDGFAQGRDEHGRVHVQVAGRRPVGTRRPASLQRPRDAGPAGRRGGRRPGTLRLRLRTDIRSAGAASGGRGCRRTSPT